MALLKKLSPARLMALGFAFVILLGAVILALPISRNQGVSVSFVDALFTSTSAVCVTGLIAVDTADTFSVFGRIVVALLIQIGGLGVTCIGVSLILLMRKRVDLKQRMLIRESWNVNTFKGIVKLVKDVLLLTLIFESVGAILSFITFVKDYPPLKAAGISVFHSIAAFNNAGFDILGGLRNLIPYQSDVLLNLVTCGLIIFGGIGFLVILDVVKNRSFKKLTLHSKTVLVMTALLLIVGTLMLKLTEQNISWLGAFLHSTSARTAGFSSYNLGLFSNAALFVLIILMFIGASPGSTGGGIKTTTFFTLFKATMSYSRNRPLTAFKRKIPKEAVQKSFVVFALSVTVVCVGTLLLCIIEPNYTFVQLLFEITSAFGTVGLSTGITPHLANLSKLIVILTMYVGRLGALTIVSIWIFRNQLPQVGYAEENINIG
ncbi:MAG: H(+)-transporting ATPase [Clostridiales bacterium]|nr:H(+)-transporting ATPase [Clostridiales bacterium]